jgi:poly-gamma-glutamate synthesis protein (capsule biosynthesis protein)
MATVRFAFLFFLLLFLHEKTSGQTPKVFKTNLSEKADRDGELTLHFVGDLMGHSPLFKYAQTADGGYDFFPYFEPVFEALSEADITIGNLETVMAGKTKDYSGYPAFNTPNEYADALKKTGFDFLVTTNNHSYDRLEAGVLRTLNELQKRNFYTFGTYRNYNERDSVRLFEAEGITFALLAYTQFSNIRVPSDKPYLVNIYEENLVKKQIAEARKAGAELIIVHYHWGDEYKKEPNAVQKEMTRTAIEAGADCIIAEHPHVLQPFEMKKASRSASVDSVFIAYSLGNFISNQQWRYSDAGVIVRLAYVKENGKIKLRKHEFVPTWVFKGRIGGKGAFRVLPAQAAEAKLPDYLQEKAKSFDFLSKNDLNKMLEALGDTRNILKLYGANSRERYWHEPKRVYLKPVEYRPEYILLSEFHRAKEPDLEKIRMPEIGKKKKKKVKKNQSSRP